MLAVACVHAAGRLHRFDPDPKHAAWMKFGGLVLSGLAFALSLARPEGAVYSGSTLVTAILGLGLYAALLIEERHPSYLYFGFGACAFPSLFRCLLFHEGFDGRRRAKRRTSARLRPNSPSPSSRSTDSCSAPHWPCFPSGFADAGTTRASPRAHCHYIGVPLAVGACILAPRSSPRPQCFASPVTRYSSRSECQFSRLPG